MKRMLQCGIGVLMVIVSTTSARADDVTDWNEMLFRAALVAGSPSLNVGRFAAIVQAAVFDAVNGIDRRYTPIHVDPAGPAGASRRAAAVYAAYDVLSRLYGQGGLFLPNQQQTLDARLAASLASIAARESAASIASGRVWGLTVGDAIWTWRSTDGFSLDPATWVGNTTLGQWRQTPNVPYPGLSAKGAGYPQFVTMIPWAIDSPSQFRPAGPPALTSAKYAKDFNETKLMGSQTSAVRTPEQTVYSWFWAAGSAPYLWNHVALSLIGRSHEDRDDDENESGDNRHDTLLRSARILASLNVAMADAGIGCWDAKYTYNAWRPITAIRETADDGNPATTPDPTWTPLFATPAHPEYTSGHSCVSGAATVILVNEFGEHTRFDVTSDLMIGVTRSFHSFTDALEEVKNARIFAGIHFRTACEDGTTLGKAVAQFLLQHKFQRLH